MIPRSGRGALVLVLAACGELSAPQASAVRLTLVPRFDRYGELAAGADQLRIRLFRLDPGPPRDSSLVKDTTVSVDAEGNASANLNVVLLTSPQMFIVRLDAVQTSDGLVLFSGEQEVSVSSTSAGAPEPIEVPVAWQGPVASRIEIAPHDTAVAAGVSFLLRATAFDESNTVIPSAPRYYLVNSAQANLLTVNRLTGLVTAAAGATGEVQVYVETLDPDPPRDTARIFVGAVAGAVRITPGYANVAVGQSVQLAAVLHDPLGNVLGPGTATWVSRTPGVATVDGGGTVTGVATGTGVVVATSGSFVDSARVTVAGDGEVVVVTAANGGTFRTPGVGDTLRVEVVADLRPAPGTELASYNARFTWNTARLAFVDTTTAQAGDFPVPLVNRDSVSAGILRFAQADPGGMTGAVVVARFRLRAVSAGDGGLQLSVTEMSGPPPDFINLRTRVTVTNGTVTVSP